MKKRKTDLFRFVTLRAPELISSERKELGFISHPDPTSSTFLVLIDENNLAASRIAMSNATSSFDAFDKVEEIRDVIPDLWDFSMWLAKNKNNIVRSELDALIPNTLPTTAQVIAIWDNLYYDVLTNSNPYVRQACLQILVGLNFANSYAIYSPGTGEEIEVEMASLKRLANGKVILHNAFSLEKQEISSNSFDFNFASKRNLKVQHYANLANCRVVVLESIHHEFNVLKKEHRRDYKAEYDRQLVVYNKRTDDVLEKYLISDEKSTDCQKKVAIHKPDRDSIERKKVTLKEEDIPDGLIEPFVFSYADPMSTEYRKGKLSAEALDYVKENCLEDSRVSDIIAHVEKSISSSKTESSKSQRKRVDTVLINGVLINPNASKIHDYAFSFEQDKYGEVPGGYKMFLSIDTGYNGAYLTNYQYSLTIGDQVFQGGEGNCPKVLCVSNQIIFVELFQGAAFTFPDCESLLFQATVQFDNGKQISIYKEGHTSVLFYTGAALAIVSKNRGVEHYGVNRIGVADFRKVEQELCCYIPGEVSHIENILAREYKEKATRNLTRSENTFESTSEREIEELTDTTSTTRHEMSTEISEVLQKDKSQNLGFDTSVNGDFGTFGFKAGGYGDFSFAQSATDSNSQARTYAEDVTRRALERIVQKTTVKRTSKILREYEETNKHGFDNREGDKHVTGVYRWVDKVYQNRIVNYGKRLMYEFMIPEPARWYKEAVIVQAEEEETSTTGGGAFGSPSVAVKPTPLSENGINSAADITRENYQAKAALYGADPDAPEDAVRTVAGSGSGSHGTGDSEQSNTHEPVIMPTNYVCTSISGTTNYNFKAKVKPKAYITVSIGGKSWKDEDLKGEGSGTLKLNTSGLSLTGNVPMSSVTKKITSFTLSVQFRCELEPKIFQQWQQDVYDEIKREYDAQLQAFNDAQTETAISNTEVDPEEDKGSASGRNPRFNSGIVHTELKRLCIEMISKPFGLDQGKGFYQVAKCNVPELELTKALDVYSSHVKFFEQAFDWDLMSKLFYPYYWAEKCDWKSLFQAQDGNDYLFQQFLQSGMGRVIVPVKEGFEDAVALFMETGKIWSGIGLVVDTDDDLYVSIVDELTKIEGRVEGEEWETIVPSSLTIVQDASVKLAEGGLPCCESDEDVLNEINFEPDTNVLTRNTGISTE